MEPKVNIGVFRHYKGNLYRVLDIADYTGEHKEIPGSYRERDGQGTVTGFPENSKLVVYIGLYNNPRGNRVCTRPVGEWAALLKNAPLTTIELAYAKSTIPAAPGWDDLHDRYQTTPDGIANYSGPRYEQVGG